MPICPHPFSLIHNFHRQHNEEPHAQTQRQYHHDVSGSGLSGALRQSRPGRIQGGGIPLSLRLPRRTTSRPVAGARAATGVVKPDGGGFRRGGTGHRHLPGAQRGVSGGRGPRHRVCQGAGVRVGQLPGRAGPRGGGPRCVPGNPGGKPALRGRGAGKRERAAIAGAHQYPGHARVLRPPHPGRPGNLRRSGP